MGLAASSTAQITMWEMNNFRKLEKQRHQKSKQKGPSIQKKKTRHKSVRSVRSKPEFSKKQYKLGYFIKEDETSLITLT